MHMHYIGFYNVFTDVTASAKSHSMAIVPHVHWSFSSLNFQFSTEFISYVFDTQIKELNFCCSNLALYFMSYVFLEEIR